MQATIHVVDSKRVSLKVTDGVMEFLDFAGVPRHLVAVRIDHIILGKGGPEKWRCVSHGMFSIVINLHCVTKV
jgi:hypothetical protein